MVKPNGLRSVIFIDPGMIEKYPTNTEIWLDWMELVVSQQALSRADVGKIIKKGTYIR